MKTTGFDIETWQIALIWNDRIERAKKKGYDDVVEICQSIIENLEDEEETGEDAGIVVGEVYLFKSGRYYKIGKTDDTVRRGQELRIQLPEKLNLIHSIKTDDPSGIETYWHKRFEAKRMQGEWFDLNSSDIKTFKRWRKIVWFFVAPEGPYFAKMKLLVVNK